MNLWYKKMFVFVSAGAVYLVGQYFRGEWISPTWPFQCHLIHSGAIVYCYAPYLDTLGWPLIMLGEMIALTGLALLFANRRGIRSWQQFSYFYVPIAALLTVWLFPLQIAPIAPPAPIWGAVRFFGVLYTLVTAGIVLYTRLRPAQKLA